MKKIIAFTAIRSEYDLLSGLYKMLTKDKNIDFRLIVSGAHLCEDFGYSINEIKNDGHKVLAEIKTLKINNDMRDRINSAANLLKESINIIFNFKPDLIIYAGDREEVAIASLIGGYLEIPTMHFFGGDHVKDSHIDNPIRHAVSKLSTIHMVSTEEHKLRLLKMGEKKQRIYNIGSPALDKFIQEKVLSKKDLEKYFNLNFSLDNYALVIFHAIPKERKYSNKIFENILLTLKKLRLKAFVSYPNIDPGSQSIIDVIKSYKNDSNFIFYKNRPRKEFISIYKNALLIIGNSSSGITESASIPIPAINVGLRQKGRAFNTNVLFSGINKDEIENTLEKALSKEFLESLKNCNNIYGNGDSSIKAYNIIKKNDFRDFIFKDEDILENFYE